MVIGIERDILERVDDCGSLPTKGCVLAGWRPESEPNADLKRRSAAFDSLILNGYLKRKSVRGWGPVSRYVNVCVYELTDKGRKELEPEP